MSHGLINLAELSLPSGVLRFRDHLHNSTYEHSRETVQHTGFPVVLPPFGTQLLAVTPHAWDAPQDEVVNASWEGQWYDREVVGDV